MIQLLLLVALLVSQNAANPASPLNIFAGGVKGLGGVLASDLGAVAGAVVESGTAIAYGAEKTVGGISHSLTSGASQVAAGVVGGSNDLVHGNIVGALSHGTGTVLKGVTDTVGGTVVSVLDGVGEIGGGVLESVGAVTGTVASQATEVGNVMVDGKDSAVSKTDKAIQDLNKAPMIIFKDVMLVIKYGPTATSQITSIIIQAFVVASVYVGDTILRHTIGEKATNGIEKAVENTVGRVWKLVQPNLSNILYPVALLFLPAGILLTILLSGLVIVVGIIKDLLS